MLVGDFDDEIKCSVKLASSSCGGWYMIPMIKHEKPREILFRRRYILRDSKEDALSSSNVVNPIADLI